MLLATQTPQNLGSNFLLSKKKTMISTESQNRPYLAISIFSLLRTYQTSIEYPLSET